MNALIAFILGLGLGVLVALWAKSRKKTSKSKSVSDGGSAPTESGSKPVRPE